MSAITRFIQLSRQHWFAVIFAALAVSACTIPRKYQKGKPFLYKNTIEIKGGNFTAAEKSSLKQRLNAQLDDSSRVQTKDALFFLHFIDKPPVYDSVSAAQSASYMRYSMQFLGYFNAQAAFRADTQRTGKQQRVTVTYSVAPGKVTLIDTNQYRLTKKEELQELALKTQKASFLKKNLPISKNAVYGEIGRLVQLYRNNGYYKFTGDELRVRGDTSIEALTNIGDDPFDNLANLAKASAKRDSPTIKLSVDLIVPKDPNRLVKYFVRNIYIMPDFQSGDSLKNPALLTDTVAGGNYIIRYHNNIFKQGFLLRNMYIKKGDVYNQLDYYRTINSFAKIGVWQSVNIQIQDVKDSTGLIDLVVELVPALKFGFDANLESSYSISSNNTSLANATVGNVLGFSGNISLINRNVAREAIRMSNAIRAGVELNVGNTQKDGLINSNEFSFNNGFAIPRLITPFKKLNKKRLLTQQTVINTNLSYINRINLFNLQSVNFSAGYEWSNRVNRKFTLRPINIEFTRLYNESDSFRQTILDNPFLRSSFTTALVAGASLNYTSTYFNPRYTSRQRNFKGNLETSGIFTGVIKSLLNTETNILEKYLRRFVKLDAEYTYTVNYPKSSVVFRLFGGVGIPISRKDTSLPFFKQYFAGGSNSMRGWPIRGLGRGAQPLAQYSTRSNTTLNDRTGDIQLEGNFEYRYNIASIIPNSVVLKGALFVDAGNTWNFKNTVLGGGRDSTQFNLKYLYNQLAVSAGTGFRIDFNYFLIRLDLALRIKRPDIDADNGWQLPSLNYKNLLSGNDANKRWRYENFNFTIGINYPF
jgi:outer membrane protein insertion porin family